MDAISATLRHDLRQSEFSEGYAESFQDAYVATQIRVLREQNKWTQADLAKEVGTSQTVISRIENVNYSAWNISTLKKLARAFRVRLKVSFETYGSLIHDVDVFSRENLQRVPRESDPELLDVAEESAVREQPEKVSADTSYPLGLSQPLPEGFIRAREDYLRMVAASIAHSADGTLYGIGERATDWEARLVLANHMMTLGNEHGGLAESLPSTPSKDLYKGLRIVPKAELTIAVNQAEAA
jgi:transcriptional regulator with XRE-family HTH domain